jgi:hypothetical protein
MIVILQEIDIKKQGVVSSYAFCQYSDIASVVKAMRTMDGEHLGNNRIKLGFGKSMATNCVWVDGIAGIKNCIYSSEVFSGEKHVNVDYFPLFQRFLSFCYQSSHKSFRFCFVYIC